MPRVDDDDVGVSASKRLLHQRHCEVVLHLDSANAARGKEPHICRLILNSASCCQGAVLSLTMKKLTGVLSSIM